MQKYFHVMPRPPTPAASASNLGLMRKTARKMLPCYYGKHREPETSFRSLIGQRAKNWGFALFFGNTFYISDMPPPPTDHAEFARCPQPLPMGSPSLPVSSCELNKNTRRCHQQPLATHLSCRLYQTCDHAVLISGRTVYMFVFTKWLKHTGLWLKVNMSSGSVASPRGLLRDVLMSRVWIHCSLKRDDQ